MQNSREDSNNNGEEEEIIESNDSNNNSFQEYPNEGKFYFSRIKSHLIS